MIDCLRPETKEYVKVALIEHCKDFSMEDSKWFLSMIFAESSFRASVIGDQGNSFGLGQVQIATAKGFLNRDVTGAELLEPQFNLNTVQVILQQLFEKYDSWENVIIVYNAGRLIQASPHLERVRNIKKDLS